MIKSAIELTGRCENCELAGLEIHRETAFADGQVFYREYQIVCRNESICQRIENRFRQHKEKAHEKDQD